MNNLPTDHSRFLPFVEQRLSQQACAQPRPSAVNAALHAFATEHRAAGCGTVAAEQWRRQRGEGGSFPLWVDVQKLCNMCVLSLSWNFFVSHDKYQTLQIPYALQ